MEKKSSLTLWVFPNSGGMERVGMALLWVGHIALWFRFKEMLVNKHEH